MFSLNPLKKCPSSPISINKTHDRKFGKEAYKWSCWPFLHYSRLYNLADSQGKLSHSTAKLSKAVQYYHYKGTQKQTNNTLSSQKCKEL